MNDSLRPDESGYIAHDHYFLPPGERLKYHEAGTSTVELEKELEDQNVLVTIEEILAWIQKKVENHENRMNVHSLNNKAAVLRNRADMLSSEEIPANKRFSGTFGELKKREDLRGAYETIITALAYLHKRIF
ncbi:MAG: hypothetical protein WC702_01440 [Patescibacteria group bacterium]